MLEKKVYKSICLLSLLTVMLMMLFIMPACYSLFKSQIENEVIFEARAIAESLSYTESAEKFLKGLQNEDNYIRLASSDGTVIYESSKMAEKSQFTYTEKIDGVGTFIFCKDENIVLKIFAVLFFPTLFFGILVYILIHLIASKLSENIVTPITNINFNTPQEDVYDELKPFVSKIKSQNMEITKQIKRLKEQKSRLGTISESMNEGLIVLDRNGTILSINQSAFKIFSKAKEALAGREFTALSEETEFVEAVKASFDGVKKFFEYSIDDNTYQIFLSPVFEKEKVGGVVILLFDISEKERAERIRREFSANVSHELKTPLTTVLGYSELIAGGIAKDEDVKGFAQKIAHESARLIGLIEDIINLSKLDEQGEVEKSSSVDLFDIAHEVIGELSSLAEKSNISMHLEGETTIVKGNASQLYELCYNLCDNAIKYNKQNGSIKVSVKNRVLCVEDTGIGIGKDDVDRIFERFYRVDKSHSKAVSGTGLGLSIVKHIALSHNAEINVESRKGEGTKITVEFKL